jgi:branched-chain amino acid aminotransferase
VRDGGIVTNDRDASILMGVTRASILELANDLGIPTSVAAISVEDAYGADELFFTGTAVEVTPIREVDGHVISGGKPGPITRRIQETFNAVTRGQRPEYKRWLAYANEKVASR